MSTFPAFSNQVSVVTGAASGIGRALAHTLAASGSHLALTDIDDAGLAEVHREVSRFGTTVSVARVDAASRDEIYAHALDTLQAFGHVDNVFNNAGVTVSSRVETLTDEDMQWVMDINFWGVVHGTKAYLGPMLERGSGRIVNISSIFGIAGFPTQSIYNASKFAVRGFTEALHIELEGTGVTAHCVHPGGVKTAIARSARVYDSWDGREDLDSVADDFEKLASTTPDVAAATILRGAANGHRRILVGIDARVMDSIVRLLPTGYDRVILSSMKRLKQSREKKRAAKSQR